MPRRRTSNKPIRRRIKLDHKGDALTEMCRTFRAVKNGDLPRADGVRDVAMLDKIHNGMPDHTASSTFTPPVINIYSVPSGFFLSYEQIEAANRGERIIEPSQCTPLLLEQQEPSTSALITIEHAPIVQPQPEPEPEPIEIIEPEPALDPIMQRAMAMGYKPLPLRPRRIG